MSNSISSLNTEGKSLWGREEESNKRKRHIKQLEKGQETT